MKRFLLTLFLLTATALLPAQTTKVGGSGVTKVGGSGLTKVIATPAPASGLLLDTDFEGTGLPTGWATNIGSPDYDSTSNPLAGAQDMFMVASVEKDASAAFTASNEIWVTCKTRRSAVSSSDVVLYFNATGGQYVGVGLGVGAEKGLRWYESGTGFVGLSTVDYLPTNTPLFFRIHLVKGTGSNAVLEAEWNTSNSFSGSGDKFASYTSGTTTNQWVNIEFYHPGGLADDIQWDDIKISNTGWPP